ncbi:hypothetical protein L207DRAFT_509399 [Hyaloscypha variabilis F]|uniref:Uncharacterized protein n=1 Tax=Hyaloscypha variabilis (strain UAMH 11265 / GT02V1 / F) TaxID=1149755 RepID=A0A2J6S1S8_HYAVF|nr:hypothetical protein L207DRAFT_509399 [Hyaloscypha variabilis F]
MDYDPPCSNASVYLGVDGVLHTPSTEAQDYSRTAEIPPRPCYSELAKIPARVPTVPTEDLGLHSQVVNTTPSRIVSGQFTSWPPIPASITALCRPGDMGFERVKLARSGCQLRIYQP